MNLFSGQKLPLAILAGLRIVGVCAGQTFTPAPAGDFPATNALIPQTASARDAALPEPARDGLRKQTAAMQLVSLEYTETYGGTALNPFVSPFTNITRFESNRFYSHQEVLQRSAAGKIQCMVHEDSFDGSNYYFGLPSMDTKTHVVPAMMTKYLANDDTDPDHDRELFKFPYLDAAGFYAPRTLKELKQFSTLEPLVLHCLAQSDSTEVGLAGENLRVTVRVPDSSVLAAQKVDLEQEIQKRLAGPMSRQVITQQIERLRQLQQMPTRHAITFLLDPNRSYAMVSREELDPTGRLAVRVDCDEWKEEPAERVWLPRRCVVSQFADAYARSGPSNSVRLQLTYALTGVEFAPKTNVSFVLDYRKPGTSVGDRTSPEAHESDYHEINYTVAAGGQLLRDTAYSARREKLRPRILGLIIILVLAILPVAWLKRPKGSGKA